MRQSNTEKLIELLELKVKEADDSTLAIDEFSFSQWVKEVEGILANLCGEDSRQLKSFRDSLRSEVRVKYFVPGEDTEYRRRQLSYAKATLKAVLFERGLSNIHTIQETATPPRAFIAHGGETEALRKLKSFLDALGVEPLVVEEEPSEARSINEQVEWCLDNADCAIVLGTADDKELKDGKLYPRRNVHIEIGRVQERFPNRVVYLLEEGASFSSNISEKVYERFSRDNMEKAFVKMVKELKAFGIIRATSIRSKSG